MTQNCLRATPQKTEVTDEYNPRTLEAQKEIKLQDFLENNQEAIEDTKEPNLTLMLFEKLKKYKGHELKLQNWPGHGF